MLAILSIYQFPRISIDLALAFPQVELDVDVFMELPLGMWVDVNRGEWVLKLNKSLYGLKKASANWFDLIKTGLKRRGYHQSIVDPWLFYRKYSVILTYVDDCVIVPHKQETIISLIESLKNGPENYVLKDEEDISNDLGVNIKKNLNEAFKWLQ